MFDIFLGDVSSFDFWSVFFIKRKSLMNSLFDFFDDRYLSALASKKRSIRKHPPFNIYLSLSISTFYRLEKSDNSRKATISSMYMESMNSPFL